MRVKSAFCTKCNVERPIAKAHIVLENGKKSRYKVFCCLVCKERVFVPNKYNAVKTRSKLSGRLFDSKKESRREPALLAMQQTGHICNLRYQVPYKLEVYSTDAVECLLEHLAKHDNGENNTDQVLMRTYADAIRRSRHKICSYRADFVYEDAHGNVVVEDVKGKAENLYRIKKRLMLACHGIEIIEPNDSGVQQKARGAGVHGAHTGSRLRGGR